MTEAERRAVAILRSYGDRACYEEMVQTIVRGDAEILEAKELGVLIRHTRAGLYMLAGDTQRIDELTRLIPQGAEKILIHGTRPPEMVQSVRTRFHLANVLPFFQYAYYGALPPQEDAEIRTLGMEHLDALSAEYEHGSRDYMAGRIADGVMLGAFVQGELAGFIGEHIEGSMGLLYVMPAFRRHHVGSALERAMIRATMLRGHTAYCQVFPDNAASQSLQRRLGLEAAQGMLYWLTDGDSF